MQEWSLIIRTTTADNLSDLEEIFLTSNKEWCIPKNQIIGIVPIHPDTEKE